MKKRDLKEIAKRFVKGMCESAECANAFPGLIDADWEYLDVEVKRIGSKLTPLPGIIDTEATIAEYLTQPQASKNK